MDRQYLQKFLANQVISDFNSGMSLEKLARKNHTHYIKIKEFLKSNGVKLRKVSNKTHIHEKEIIRLYKSGIDSVTIGKRLHIAAVNVRKCLKHNGIERRKREQYCKKYPINLDQFRDPSNLIASYWLGFLYADGHLRKYEKTGTHIMKVKLQLRDIGHLYKLARDLYTTKIPTTHIKERNGKTIKSTTLIINNKEFYHILKSYGWFEFKNGEIKLPVNLNLRHFVRGLFDGDGIVSTDDRKRYLRIGFCSPHRPIVEYVKRLCDGWINEDYCKRKLRKRHIYYTYWQGDAANRLARFLYCNSIRYLDRKMELIYKYIGH